MIWRPYAGMQTRFLQSTAFETLAGGSRGPGKTDVGVINGLKPKYLTNSRARGLVIRKNADDLADWLDRARYYSAKYGGVVTGKPGIISFPSGYKIKTGHLKDENAYTKYQGQEYHWILIEELTQIAREIDYLKLIASCRSSIPGLDPRVYATTNPGGIGHAWVKRRFIDPSPPNTKFIGSDTKRTRIFLPGTVDDNPAIVMNDPDYVKFLDGLKDTDEELYKAWRLGDWNTFAGQFFREFRTSIHVVKPFTPKADLMRVGGMDWGRTDPFCQLYATPVTIKYTGLDKTDPTSTQLTDYTFTRVFVFQEVYGTDKMPAEWGRIMNSHCDIGTVKWIECDNMIFNKQDDGSTSIADQFYDYDPRYHGRLKMQAHTQLSENKTQRINGWENIHKWLSIAPDGFPYLLITENCTNLIRTLPELVHDETNVEDVDQAAEDHGPDALRYMLKAIRWIDAKLGGIHRKQMIQSTMKHIKADQPLPLTAWDDK